LVSDSEATLYTRHWYKTDENGLANVISNGGVIVVIANEKVVTQAIAPNAKHLC
jgi:uncharacterized protein affecting Mg2+/Co2+ transport